VGGIVGGLILLLIGGWFIIFYHYKSRLLAGKNSAQDFHPREEPSLDDLQQPTGLVYHEAENSLTPGGRLAREAENPLVPGGRLAVG